ncbi:UNVERIFIED_CONTAM: hypothetical protein NCL1_54734 [Trichonephila clavipes]
MRWPSAAGPAWPSISPDGRRRRRSASSTSTRISTCAIRRMCSPRVRPSRRSPSSARPVAGRSTTPAWASAEPAIPARCSPAPPS